MPVTVLAATLCLASSLLGGKLVADEPNPSPPDLSAVDLEFFEKTVRPLLVEHCYECHSGDERSGGLLLDSRAGWQAGGDTGHALVPGKPDESLLIEAIRYRNRDLQMPPEGKLGTAELAALEKWVASGAPDPRETTAVARAATGMSIQAGRQFWSFRPLSRPPIPAPRRQARVQTPIDAFVLARLEKAGLQPAPRADRRTWIRRVTLDLIGLPPTPADVEAFLTDQSENAFERVVERLLGSPQYGERWGRHWLDVARYADSNGLDENLAFGNAWRYRDYVVASFNADKPFDQFLIEQLAGDLLPQASEQTRTATGFLALGAKVLAEPDREKLVMDTVDEQLDATGKAFLGMTLGCVRCHDHKFDPIKQDDYYALAAIFKSTRTFAESKQGAIKHWYEHSFASDEQRKELESVEAEIKAKQSAATEFKNKAMAALRTEAVKNAAKYLAAAAQFAPSATLGEVRAIAAPIGLHPRILHHCRLHLEYNSDTPLVAKWKQLAAQRSPAEIQEYFERLIHTAQLTGDPDEKGTTELPPRPEQAKTLLTNTRAELANKSGLLSVPPQPEYALDDRALREYYRLLEEARLLESDAPDEPGAMGVSDGSVLVSLPVHIRGSHRNLGDAVERGFPEVMRTSATQPVWPADQSGRLELARWMASSQHPLTARVYVNRVWNWHFGKGIVASTENFGQLGERPTHPELLDWLARYFIESGWSTKKLHRLILASSAYQMASVVEEAGEAPAVDPENRLLWKFRLQRLEAEQIRDAMLAIAGRLDTRIGGKTVPLRNRQFVFNHTSVDHTKYDSLRRAIYLPIIRNNLYTLFEQFDFPDPTTPTGSRNATVVAPQALLMMNDELVMDSASALASHVMGRFSQDDLRVDYAYNLAFARPPTDAEADRALRFLASLGDQSELSEQDRWSLLCQSWYLSNEFVYVK